MSTFDFSTTSQTEAISPRQSQIGPQNFFVNLSQKRNAATAPYFAGDIESLDGSMSATDGVSATLVVRRRFTMAIFAISFTMFYGWLLSTWIESGSQYGDCSDCSCPDLIPVWTLVWALSGLALVPILGQRLGVLFTSKDKRNQVRYNPDGTPMRISLIDVVAPLIASLLGCFHVVWWMFGLVLYFQMTPECQPEMHEALLYFHVVTAISPCFALLAGCLVSMFVLPLR